MSEIIKNPNEISDNELDNVSGGTDENTSPFTPANTPDRFENDGKTIIERPDDSTTYQQAMSNRSRMA